MQGIHSSVPCLFTSIKVVLVDYSLKTLRIALWKFTLQATMKCMRVNQLKSSTPLTVLIGSIDHLLAVIEELQLDRVRRISFT